MRSFRPDKARVGYNYVSTEIRPRYGGYGTRVMVTDGHGIYLFIYFYSTTYVTTCVLKYRVCVGCCIVVKSNQIKFINIQQQMVKSTYVKRNKMNNVRILKGEVGHKWL